MNMQWSDFLRTRTEHHHPASPICALNDLSHFGLIQVEGEDAMQFLQGQLTNDLREVTEQHSHLSGWCSAKGRMLANFRVLRRGPAYLLLIPLAQLEPVLKRLRMYVLRSKVTLGDVSEQWARFGLTGDCAVTLLQRHFQALPDAANEVRVQGDTVLIRMPGNTPRYRAARTRSRTDQGSGSRVNRKPRPWTAISGLCRRSAPASPTVYPETSEAFVPQMTNMQLIDGVSFTKGCYTGQEVVARMQYLGKLKRRMYLAHVECEAAPRPGDELFAQDSTSGQGTGKVVDAQASGDGYDLLAVIEINSAEQGLCIWVQTDPPGDPRAAVRICFRNALNLSICHCTLLLSINQGIPTDD